MDLISEKTFEQAHPVLAFFSNIWVVTSIAILVVLNVALLFILIKTKYKKAGRITFYILFISMFLSLIACISTAMFMQYDNSYVYQNTAQVTYLGNIDNNMKQKITLSVNGEKRDLYFKHKHLSKIKVNDKVCMTVTYHIDQFDIQEKRYEFIKNKKHVNFKDMKYLEENMKVKKQ